jgi:RNA polymerase sigma-70 factor (ECF subfamily)
VLARLARLTGAQAAVPQRVLPPAAAPPELDVRRGGPADEFHTLVLAHLDSAYNLARYLSRNPTVADDLVQDALLRAYRSFATYRGGDSRAWLLAIVRNCFFSWRAAQAARPTVPLDTVVATDSLHDGAAEPVAPVTEETPETHLLRSAAAAEVRAHIEALPEPFRETLVLRELEDLSYKEIAQITAVPIGTVMSRLARARRLLAEGLESQR